MSADRAAAGASDGFNGLGLDPKLLTTLVELDRIVKKSGFLEADFK